MTTLVLLSALAWPKAMAVTLAGMDIRPYPTTECRYDPKSKFFVYLTNDCDGSHRSITLTRDRRLVGDLFDTSRFGRKSSPAFADAAIKERALPLSTEDGIKIGITPKQLQAKMGKPFKTAKRGAKGEFWCALYKKVQMENKDAGQVLRNTFIFKDSKLAEISINLDSVPGCGDDSLSDAGWPWTRF